jgi:hypothetical protein
MPAGESWFEAIGLDPVAYDTFDKPHKGADGP